MYLADDDAGADGGDIARLGNVQAALGHSADGCALLDRDVLGHDAVLDGRAGLDDRAAHNDGCFHRSALLNDCAGEQDGIVDRTVDLAALGDHRVGDGGVAADLLAGTARVAGVDLPVLIEQVDAGMLRVQDLHVGLPQAGDRANVLPVAA